MAIIMVTIILITLITVYNSNVTDNGKVLLKSCRILSILYYCMTVVTLTILLVRTKMMTTVIIRAIFIRCDRTQLIVTIMIISPLLTVTAMIIVTMAVMITNKTHC